MHGSLQSVMGVCQGDPGRTDGTGLVLRVYFGDLCPRPKLPPMCDRTALYDEHKAQLLVQTTDGAQTGQLIF